MYTYLFLMNRVIDKCCNIFSNKHKRLDFFRSVQKNALDVKKIATIK